MNNTDKFNSLDYEVTNNWMKYLLWIILVMCIGFAVINFVFKSPSVIVQNYEWFHKAFAQHTVNTQNIAGAAILYKEETDNKEKQRLRIELSAMQQVCNLNVQNYNARSAQITTSWAKGESLPEKLNIKSCE